jgi:hypothetical protein
MSYPLVDDDPIPEIVVKKEGTITAFLSAVDLTHHVLVGFIFDWIRMETINMATTSHRLGLCEHDRSQPYMPFSTYAHKTVSTFKALPISQTSPWSFHLPLFRFLSFCLIELSRRPNDNGYEALLKKLLDVEGDHKSIELLRGLMEFIVLLLSRVSQIKAGLWRRNGTSMLDQVCCFSNMSRNIPPLSNKNMTLLCRSSITAKHHFVGYSEMLILLYYNFLF